MFNAEKRFVKLSLFKAPERIENAVIVCFLWRPPEARARTRIMSGADLRFTISATSVPNCWSLV